MFVITVLYALHYLSNIRLPSRPSMQVENSPLSLKVLIVVTM